MAERAAVIRTLALLAMVPMPAVAGDYRPSHNWLSSLTIGNTMTCSASFINMDAGTLYLDCSNNRVGVGTTAPGYSLDVADDLRVQDQAIVVGSATVQGTAFSVGTTTLSVTGGRVGIGLTTPAVLLDVGGAAQFGSGVLKSTFSATPDASTYALALASGVSISTGGVRFADGTIQYTLASSSLTPSGNNVLTGNNAITAPLALANGSAGSPSLTASSDRNTGVHWGGDDTLSLVAGGANTIRIQPDTPLRILKSGAVTSDISLEGDDGANRIESGQDLAIRVSIDRIWIESTGEVGIGTTAPGSGNKLSVQGGAFIVGVSTIVTLSGNTGFGTATPCSTCTVHAVGNINATGALRQGDIRSCATGLTSDADGKIDGCVASDRRLKSDVTYIPSVGTIVDRLRPAMYRWRPDLKKDDRLHAGFIAQDLQETLPEAVVEAGTPMMGVDPNAILAIVVSDLQALRKRVKQLEAK